MNRKADQRASAKPVSFHVEQFLDYIRNYDMTDEQIALKAFHTMKVLEAMDRLCHEQEIDPELAYYADLCALYHDLGRFEQVRRFHTFLDAKSADHAALSVEELEKNGFLEDLEPEWRSRVLNAIACHSAFEIPAFDDGKTEVLARLLRDADKIDIFRVFAKDTISSALESSVDELSRLELTEAVRADLRNHRSVLKSHRTNPLDIWAAGIGFYYDLNFPASVNRVITEGYLRELFSHADFLKKEARQDLLSLLDEAEQYMLQRVSQD